MSTRVIAIVNQKGGVGKTTTTANLGAYLAYLKKKVLLIDLDPQSNLSLHYGVNFQKSEKSCYELMLVEDTGFRETVINTEIDNLDLIPSSIMLADAELELVNVAGRERVLSEALEEIIESQIYDFVFIDCSPSLGLLTVNALTTAREVFIVVLPDYFALQGIGRLIRTLNLVKKRLNSDLDVTGIIMCMFNPARKLSWEVIAKIREFFKEKVFKTFIRVNVNLAEAPSHGQSILTYAPKSHGAEDYFLLAKEVLDGGKRYLAPEENIYETEHFEEFSLKNLNRHTNILFVDDDREICNTIKEVFSTITQHFRSLNSYEHAVKYLEKNTVDIIITDVNLPGKDGFELVKWVNRKKNLIGIPIIMITGVMRDIDSVIRSRKIGVDKFIVKPFNLSRLIKDVDTILDPIYIKRKRLKLMKKIK